MTLQDFVALEPVDIRPEGIQCRDSIVSHEELRRIKVPVEIFFRGGAGISHSWTTVGSIIAEGLRYYPCGPTASTFRAFGGAIYHIDVSLGHKLLTQYVLANSPVECGS